MRVRTKIICTIGPSVASAEKMAALIEAGMNVARINTSHGTHDEYKTWIDILKNLREVKKVPLAIMLDTKGPEVRIGKVKGDKLLLNQGDRLCLVKETREGDLSALSLVPSHIIDDIPLGATLLFDDGYINSTVIEKSQDRIIVEIANRGLLSSRKGVNLPHIELNLPALTEEDIDDIHFGIDEDIDILAASFIRSAEHILEIKKLLATRRASHILVIAKIENALGVENFDAILQVADGIMIARGDLGVELPLAQVPELQKNMIRKCYQSLKPVVTATQMLESMIQNPRPTRAEVSDIANAIYDSTSAVMLSGETAVGNYPIETVRMMHDIIVETEKNFNYVYFFHKDVAQHVFHDISSSVALAAVNIAYTSQGQALVVLTTSGRTARIMARFRPAMPIIALTPHRKTYNQLAFIWGVVPLYQQVKDVRDGLVKASCFLLRKDFARYGDLIIVTSGSPFGIIGTTNMILVDNIGDVLVRGTPGKGRRVNGEVALILSRDSKKKRSAQGCLVVLPYFDKNDASYLEGAVGMILQNHPDDLHSEWEAKQVTSQMGIPLLVRADAACSILKEGQMVTLDPLRGLVFNGVVVSEDDMLAQVCRLESDQK